MNSLRFVTLFSIAAWQERSFIFVLRSRKTLLHLFSANIQCCVRYGAIFGDLAEGPCLIIPDEYVSTSAGVGGDCLAAWYTQAYISTVNIVSSAKRKSNNQNRKSWPGSSRRRRILFLVEYERRSFWTYSHSMFKADLMSLDCRPLCYRWGFLVFVSSISSSA
jgi:hypothetical protein